MTPEIKKALDLALEALRSASAELYRASSYCNTYEVLGNTNDAITAIQQALESPTVQEPVGTYGEIYESMQALLRSGLQSDQQIYTAMKDKPLYTSPPTTQPAPCTWTKSNDPHMPDTFNATCGVVWTFTDGGPVENGVRFCPGCGAVVSVAAPEPEEDLFDLAVKADNGGQP
jgi:hypothetical protein